MFEMEQAIVEKNQVRFITTNGINFPVNTSSVNVSKFRVSDNMCTVHRLFTWFAVAIHRNMSGSKPDWWNLYHQNVDFCKIAEIIELDLGWIVETYEEPACVART